jgi:putative restriction endonuclease
MARLSKKQLLATVERSINESEWNFLYITPRNQHPACYRIYRDGKPGVNVRVYIWNISHGGGAARAANEFRIQITGFDHFEQVGSEKTIILGWWDDVGAFAGFDYRYHSGPLGASPSMQVSGETMRRAHVNGFAPYHKGSGEIAIAFRPDFMGTYIANLEHLHDLGDSADFNVLQKVAENPAVVSDAEIAQEATTPEREFAIITTKRALRDISFRRRVLTAYSHRCALCGIQLDLLDAAHILPVNVTGSNDETSNGVALCALHHRAYDRSLVMFDKQYSVHVNAAQARELSAAARGDGLVAFQTGLRGVIDLPPDRRDHPKAANIEQANALRGW